MEYPSGKKYEGDWVCGLKEGEGTLYYPNGDVYKGRWKADKVERCYHVKSNGNGSVTAKARLHLTLRVLTRENGAMG